MMTRARRIEDHNGHVSIIERSSWKFVMKKQSIKKERKLWEEIIKKMCVCPSFSKQFWVCVWFFCYTCWVVPSQVNSWLDKIDYVYSTLDRLDFYLLSEYELAVSKVSEVISNLGIHGGKEISDDAEGGDRSRCGRFHRKSDPGIRRSFYGTTTVRGDKNRRYLQSDSIVNGESSFDERRSMNRKSITGHIRESRD